MKEISLPPTLRQLYRLDDLMKGYDPQRPESILETYSFRQFQAYCPYRSPKGWNLDGAKKIAEHDAMVSDSLFGFLYNLCDNADPILPVGFMGSSSLGRGQPEYADFARIARQVAQAGFLVVTGGGPAMMEAASLGAYFARAPEDIFEAALKTIAGSKVVKLPRGEFVDVNGDPTPNMTPNVISDFHSWFKDAHDLAATWHDPAPCLAVSTWEYGQEPVMPFASHYAAYFQNSIREAALVRESTVGMIYGRGGGGTIREIFQDVEENYYVKELRKFTPMIFFDRASYWAPEPAGPNSSGMAIFEAVKSIFLNAFGKNPVIHWPAKVVNTVETDIILSLLADNKPQTIENAAAFFDSQISAAPTTFI